MKRLAVTGTIGSGKSTFCRALRAVGGAPIYDSDSRAKSIMTSSEEVQRGIVEIFGPEAYICGELNKPFISSKAFNNPDLLARLNGVVHPAVVADFEIWAESQQGVPYVILESALLFTSPLVGHYDMSVVVDAPLEERVERCMRRDGATREQVLARMRNQLSSEQMIALADKVVLANGFDAHHRQAIEVDKLIREL